MPGPAATQVCVGDCNDNRAVSTDELKGITFRGKDIPGALKLVSGNVIPGAALTNADSYRCWVRDSSIGDGNDRLDQDLY